VVRNFFLQNKSTNKEKGYKNNINRAASKIIVRKWEKISRIKNHLFELLNNKNSRITKVFFSFFCNFSLDLIFLFEKSLVYQFISIDIYLLLDQNLFFLFCRFFINIKNN